MASDVATFAGVDELVPDLTMALLDDETARPMLVLVAEVDGDVVGNIIFSTVRVTGCEQVASYLLAPLAVAKRVHRQGIGRDMIETGMRMVHARNVKVIFVLGDPRYYGRFGFKPGHRIHAPYELPYPEAWMVRALPGASLEGVCGTLVCARTFYRPEYWWISSGGKPAFLACNLIRRRKFEPQIHADVRRRRKVAAQR